MKSRTSLALLFFFLAACTPAVTSTLTKAPVPTAVPPNWTATADIHETTTPSPIPTQSFPPVITPDAIQVAGWKEYEAALAQSILPMFPVESILCEWDILARSSQEVYLWAVCGSSKGDDSRPAVIHLGADGSVDTVEVPERGSPSDIDRMFPKEVQMKFSLYTGNSIFTGRSREMYNHLIYREAHPEEPPLIVLSATPTP